MKKLIFAFALLFLSIGTMAQTIVNSTVVAVIPLGNQAFSVLNETGTENYYKTSPHANGALNINQQIQIELHPNNNVGRVLAPTLSEPLFCRIIQPNTPLEQVVNILVYMPQLENNILFFEDTTQIRLFYDEIVELSDISKRELDVLLNGIEAQFVGFNSYRTWFNNEYDWLNGAFTSKEIEGISKLEFMNDEIIKTFFNENRFIGIGDSVYYYHNQNVVVSVKKDYSRGILALSALPTDYDVYGTGSIVLSDSAMKAYSELYEPGSGPKGVAIVTDSLRYESWPNKQNVNCNVHEKLLRIDVTEFFTNISGNLEAEPYYENGTLSINWDDGTPIQIINSYNGEWISHYYTTTAFTYHPTTSFVFTDRYGDAQTLDDGDGTAGQPIKIIVEFACTDANDDLYGAMVSGEWMMTNKLWVNHNFWGKHIGSYTHFWRKNSGGTWERHKADIYTSVTGTFRDDNCTAVEGQSGSDLEHLQKKVQKTKTKLFKQYDISNGDIKSHHYFVKGSLFLQLDLELVPC